MIAILLGWLTFFFVVVSIGNIAVRVFQYLVNAPSSYDIFDFFFIGVCMVGAIANTWSIFLPTNQYLLLLFISVSAFYTLSHLAHLKKNFHQLFNDLKGNNKYIIIFIFFMCIIGSFSLIPPIIYDTYAYHLPSIQWIEKYNVLPGLANVNTRFGFNSSILVLSSVFSLDFLFSNQIFVVNSICMLVFILWLAFKSLIKPAPESLIYILFIYLFIAQYLYFISSPATDLLPNLLCAFLLLRVLFNSESVQESTVIYWLIPLFCLTLKLSAFPIVLICLLPFSDLRSILSVKRIIAFCCIGGIVIIPWLSRNVILTGYLFYPLPAIDLFSFDWKIPIDKVIAEKDAIYSWARVPGVDSTRVLTLKFSEWFPGWWSRTSNTQRLVFIINAFSPLVLLLLKIRQRPLKLNWILLVVWLVSFIGFTSWLLTAPDWRFSYSFLLILSVFPIMLFNRFITSHEKLFKSISYSCLIIISIIFLYAGLITVHSMVPKTKLLSLLEKPAYLENGSKIDYTAKKIGFLYWLPSARTDDKFGYNIETIGTTSIYVPKTGNQCFDKFPCAPCFDEKVKMRGDKIEDGFRYEQMK